MNRLLVPAVLVIMGLLLAACGDQRAPEATGVLPPPQEAPAVDQVAWWAAGTGTVDGDAADRGMRIADGASISSADKPVRLWLAGCGASRLDLVAGTSLRLVRNAADGSLTIAIREGSAALDLVDRGPYERVWMEGAAGRAEVLGTLLNTQRVDDGMDAFLLVHGKVNVQLKSSVAKELGLKEDEVLALSPRQLLTVDVLDGFGDLLNPPRRPQLTGNQSIVAQAENPESGTDWEEDDLADSIITQSGPEVDSDEGGEPVGGTDSGIDDGVEDATVDDVADNIAIENVDIEDIDDDVTDAANTTILDPELGDFPQPP